MLGLGLDLAFGEVLKFGISLVLEVDRGAMCRAAHFPYTQS